MRHFAPRRCQVMAQIRGQPQGIVARNGGTSHNKPSGNSSSLTEPIRMPVGASDGRAPCPDTHPSAASVVIDGEAYPLSSLPWRRARPVSKRIATQPPATPSPMGGEKSARVIYHNPHPKNSQFSRSESWCSAFDTDCQHVKDKTYCAEHLPSEGGCPFIVKGVA